MRIDSIQKEYGLYIGGKWCMASDGGKFESVCPADGRFLALCAEATKEDVDSAVQAAWKAFETWKDSSPFTRSAVLNAIADAIEENKNILAYAEMMDTGKPEREAILFDIPSAVEEFRYFAGCILAEKGEANMVEGNMLSVVLKEPIGVVGQIVPWNFPMIMSSWKIAPALAAGCCVVFKPSSETSLSALLLAKITEDIIPPGVLNVITGAGSKTGTYLLDHPDICKYAFTGSTEVGYSVAKAAAGKVIPATMELGGKSANIFFEDCDWELAMDGLQMGILVNQGQICAGGSRILVQDSIYEKFIEDAAKRFDAVKVGLPWEDGVMMSSLINLRQMEKVLGYVEIGKKEGARVACGGYRMTEGELKNGFFIKPTLLVDATNDMRVAQEEIFGPVAVVIKFHDEEEAIRIANDSVYGLAGGVFTNDLNRALRVARGVVTGRMWVNTYSGTPANAPFGGRKKSGYGRETDKEILNHYTVRKNILINLNRTPSGLWP